MRPFEILIAILLGLYCAWPLFSARARPRAILLLPSVAVAVVLIQTIQK